MALHGEPIAIVLAAGESRRFGRPKLFEPVDGIALVERVVETHRRSHRVHDVLIVHPPGRAEDFSWLRSTHVHLVENQSPEGGMITSIRVGLRSTWAQGRDFLLHPGDVPFVPPEIVDRLVAAFLARSCAIAYPTYKGLGGHPGLYAARLADDFYLHGDVQGAREVLLRHTKETARIAVHEPDVCFDVDTPADLAIAGDPGARWAKVEAKVEAKRAGRAG